MIKIHIRRNVPEAIKNEVMDLVNQLRATIVGHPGYLSSETLRRIDRPGEILVVSKWQSDFYWKQWYESPQRKEIQNRIDEKLDAKTQYEVYDYE